MAELEAALQAAREEAAASQTAAEAASRKAAAAAEAADTAVASTITELQQQLEQVTCHLASTPRGEPPAAWSSGEKHSTAVEAVAVGAGDIQQLQADITSSTSFIQQQAEDLQEMHVQLQHSRAEAHQLRVELSHRMQQLSEQQQLIRQLRHSVLNLQHHHQQQQHSRSHPAKSGMAHGNARGSAADAPQGTAAGCGSAAQSRSLFRHTDCSLRRSCVSSSDGCDNNSSGEVSVVSGHGAHWHCSLDAAEPQPHPPQQLSAAVLTGAAALHRESPAAPHVGDVQIGAPHTRTEEVSS